MMKPSPTRTPQQTSLLQPKERMVPETVGGTLHEGVTAELYIQNSMIVHRCRGNMGIVVFCLCILLTGRLFGIILTYPI